MGATTTTALVTVLACGVVALLVALVTVRRRAAAEQARRQDLEHALEQARTDVAALGTRLDVLGHEVLEARHTAERAAARSAQPASRTEREFVITSLGDTEQHPPRQPAGASQTGSGLQPRLFAGLLRAVSRHDGPPSGAAAELLVKAAALGHGVRRALSPDVLDRAAAAATVARRRSRRDRKRELREARRVLRSVHERPAGKHVA